jgi:translation initiation factor eIF-2B subunit delta
MTDPTTAPAEAAKPVGAPAAESNLSPAELKKRAKAEKAARRAAEKVQRGGPQANGATTAPTPKREQKHSQKEGKVTQQHDKGQQQKGLPIRRRGSYGATGALPKEPKVQQRREHKEFGLFGHLYGNARRHKIEGATKEIHPAVLSLGLQMSSYVVCGSTARCVAMLLAFKSVRRYSMTQFKFARIFFMESEFAIVDFPS